MNISMYQHHAVIEIINKINLHKKLKLLYSS